MSIARISILLGAIILAWGLIAAGAAWFVIGKQAPVVKAPPQVVVETRYGGAEAAVVEEMVAAPIEQQVNGVDGMVSLFSQCGSDGSYMLRVIFEEGTDLNLAQTQVQNRVSLASPMLPEAVQQLGITIRKKAHQPLILISITSPEQQYDALYLSNYAKLEIKDELARLPGVGDVVLVGKHDVRWQVQLDADKLNQHQLQPTEVIDALRQQNVQVTTEGGQDRFFVDLQSAGRLIEPAQLGDILLRTNPSGELVRLHDVATFKVHQSEQSQVLDNGSPAVLLAIQPIPGANTHELSMAVDNKLAELQANAPHALSLSVALDLAQSPLRKEHLVVDIAPTAGASRERIAEHLDHLAEVLQVSPGVERSLVMTGHPFASASDQPCAIVVLKPRDQRQLDRAATADRLRTMLAKHVPGAISVSVPNAKAGRVAYGYPIEFVVQDQGGVGRAALLQIGDSIVQQLRALPDFVDAHLAYDLQDSPAISFDVDRDRCRELGINLNEVFAALRDSTSAEALQELTIRNSKGESIPLAQIATAMLVARPALIERHNLKPVIRIHANLADDAPLSDAKSQCESIANTAIGGKAMKLEWMR